MSTGVETLDDLRRRIAAARWPSKELVADRSQGVQLATLQELARYWATEHDWRKVEAKLNALLREVAARERVAADHDPRLARLGDRAARNRRPADEQERAAADALATFRASGF